MYLHEMCNNYSSIYNAFFKKWKMVNIFVFHDRAVVILYAAATQD